MAFHHLARAGFRPAALATVSLLLIGWCLPAAACDRDGTDGPCHCVERIISGITGADTLASAAGPAVTVSSSTSASAEGAAAPITASVHLGGAAPGQYYFTPNPTTIHVGDTIQWTWDTGGHTVTSAPLDPEAFDSGYLDASTPGGATYSHTFTTAGTYNYYCQVHGFSNSDGSVGGHSGSLTVLPVPEPTGLALLGLAAVALVRRRRPA